MRHIGTALAIGCVWWVVFCPLARGATFAGGTGEPNDPYQVATAAQLLAIGSDPNLFKKHFILTASIDLGGQTRSAPVIPYLSGTFDGDGHTIANMHITGSGVFEFITEDGEVRNLGVVGIVATDNSYAGALVSQNLGGRVLNCYSTGEVTSDNGGAGGLIGFNAGTVANSWSEAAVGGGSFVGGLVGENMGTVSCCHATGEVSGNGQVGGLAGGNAGKIAWSYSLAKVTGFTWFTGGLVGMNNGQITSCYADATVVGEHDRVGGLVGWNMGLVAACYSTGSVSGEEDVGGLVGEDAGGGVRTSYSTAAVTSWGWYVGGLVGQGSAPETCYFLAPSEGGGPDNEIGTPLTRDQMKQQASFLGWDFWGTDLDGTNDYWFMPMGAPPVLAWQTEITGLNMIPDVAGLPLAQAQAVLAAAGFVVGDVSYDYHRTIAPGSVIAVDPHLIAPVGTPVDLIVSLAGKYDWTANPGGGTTASPYQIETPGQLESLADHPELWGSHFLLCADLDMTGRVYTQALIAPDTSSSTGFQGTAFSGTFDGQGHTIGNLTISADSRHDYAGLFGMIALAGRVDNLNLRDVNVKGGSGSSSYVGALAGYNAGIVTGCSATGVLHGGKGDGMVGFNAGSLVGCSADVMRL